jgi:TRAP-type uncharacterized transport system fused permease subunit
MFHVIHNELLITSINAMVIVSAYFFIYPQFAGSNLNKLMFYDVVSCATALLTNGYIFWGKEIKFNALFFTTNWFWFSILTSIAIELPLFIKYMKKYSVEIK